MSAQVSLLDDLERDVINFYGSRQWSGERKRVAEGELSVLLPCVRYARKSMIASGDFSHAKSLCHDIRAFLEHKAELVDKWELEEEA